MSMLGYKLSALRGKFRRNFITFGVSQLLLIVCGIAAGTFLCDYLFNLPWAIRALLLLGSIGGIAYAVYRFLVYPLSVPISDDDLALTYENAYPGSANILISAVQLSRDIQRPDYPYSKILTENVIRHGDSFAESLDLDRLAPTSNLKQKILASVGAAALCLIAASAFPKEAGIWLNRLFLGSAKWPRATTLVVKAPANVVRGKDAVVTIEARGQVPSKLKLSYQTAGGVSASAKFGPKDSQKPAEFQYTFTQLLEAVKFQIQGGDDESDWLTIQVKIPPRLHEVFVAYHLPAYTGIPAGQRQPGGHVDTLQGARVEFFGVSNEPLNKAWLEFENEAKVELKVNGKNMTGSFEVKERTSYIVRMISTIDLENVEVQKFSIEARQDRVPGVTILKPGRDMLVLADSTISLLTKFDDDYGIKSAAVRFQITRKGEPFGKEQTLAIPIDKASKSLQLSTPFALGGLGLQEGDEIAYAVEALDANNVTGPGVGKSNPYKFEVVSRARLEEEVDKLGADVLADLDSLIQLQKKVVTDTDDLASQIKSTGKFEEPHTRRLQSLVLYQDQVTLMTETVVMKLTRMIDDITTFNLSHMRIIGALKNVSHILEAVLKTKSPQAVQFLKNAPASGAAEKLLPAYNKEKEILVDLLSAQEAMLQFAQISGIIRDVKGLIQKENELKQELQQEHKKNQKK
jgi:hypothetical protein